MVAPHLQKARRANSCGSTLSCKKVRKRKLKAASFADLPWWAIFQYPQRPGAARAPRLANIKLPHAALRAERTQEAVARACWRSRARNLSPASSMAAGDFHSRAERKDFSSKSNFRVALTAEAAFHGPFRQAARETEAAPRPASGYGICAAPVMLPLVTTWRVTTSTLLQAA